MSDVSRKPIPSLSIANGSPKLENVPEGQQWASKGFEKVDLEKGTARPETENITTEQLDHLDPPVPAYKRVITGFGDFGDQHFAFGKTKTFHWKKPDGDKKNANKRLSVQSRRLSQRFGQEIQGEKKYLGLSKRSFLLSLAALIVIVLAVSIALGVGLKKIHRPQNLPLPSNKDIHTGDLTYYAPGLGACGITNKDSDSIVAVSHLVFDAVQKGSNPNQNPLCGKKIRASRYNEKAGSQRSVDLTVTDRCVGCKATDIDVTTSVFDQLADRDAGRVVTTWAWLDVDL